jgi:hypothetical protein
MTYEFGDYKVKTKHTNGGLFSYSDWVAYVYYKDNWFQTIKFNYSEASALKMARYAILAHKAELRQLANV